MITNTYPYQPAHGGIERCDGGRRFNRPLYSSVSRSSRLIALAGDRPEFMVMEISSTKSMNKLANIKLGVDGEQWLDAVTPVLTRYELGLQHYEVGSPASMIELDAVRGISFEGLLLRVHCHGQPSGPLVAAMGGRATANYDLNQAAAFSPDECHGTRLSFAGNVLMISEHGPALYATASVPLRYGAADPSAVSAGPKALLAAAPAKEAAVGALVADWPPDGVIYLIVTTDTPDSEGVAAYLAEPERLFAQAVEENRELATAVTIETPDPYLDAALPAALLGCNAAWNAPAFRHGAIAWHDSFAGWRVTYGATVAGWHERVQSHVQAFFGVQSTDGRIPSMLERDGIYNMNEELVDQALYDYEWTGDLEPLRNGGFDAIARHLAWGETHMRTPDGLYENFLNAWNTDYKWCNGGGGTIASAYYWRANRTMAEIARQLDLDPDVFQTRADEIAAAMKALLWSEQAGVYGEYRDTQGLKLLHESPDLSTIYTPIDLGCCDPFESYRMLRFALLNFETVTGLPRDGALIYTSEWLPNQYSTRGIYSAETINTLLALYRTGQSAAAEPLRRAIDGSFFAGPGPGSTGYMINPDGTYKPHTDFTDSTSMYVRNVVEGLFGVRMRAPENRVLLQPGFPQEWDHASIRCPAVAYSYAWDGTTETMRVTTPRALSRTIRLRARRAEIAKVSIDGIDSTYQVEPGVGYAWITIATDPGTETQVAVTYGAESLPLMEVPVAEATGQSYAARVDRGRIEAVRQGDVTLSDVTSAADSQACTLPLLDKAGAATFFVLVSHCDVRMWLPVEISIPVQEKRAGGADTDTVLKPTPLDLGAFRNQRLADLHRNTYMPRVASFQWPNWDGLRTVLPNGRSWWETHGRTSMSQDTARLTKAGGEFLTDNGIPFAVPAEGNDAVFTSLYESFPDRIEIPVHMHAHKVCFLVAASVSLMQSRMENGRITVKLDDGTAQELALRDPETIDDWLGSGYGKPYLLGREGASAQPVGSAAHAVLLEMDLGANKKIASITLETRTNETLIGLLGITLLQA